MNHPITLVSRRTSRLCRGLTLVELMIAMVLGLVVLLGVMGVVSANRQNYRATEALSEIQENARTAFELLARDIRQAADTGCGSGQGVVDNPALAAGWWQTWNPVRGFDNATATPAVAFGTGAGRRINGTDALQLQGVDSNASPILALVPVNTTTITTRAGHNFRRNDVLMVCDMERGRISVLQNEPAGGPALTIESTGDELSFRTDGQVARYNATTWYVGDNARPADGGRSLYRARLSQGSGAPATVLIEEILPGVQNMQLRYRGNNPGGQLFAPATAAIDWDQVNAVEIELTLVNAERNVASDDAINAERRLQRTFTSIVALRNRTL